MRRSGLTLIEIAIASAILAILLGSIYSIFFTTNRFYETEIQLRAAQFELQAAMDQIITDIQESGKGMVRVDTFVDPAFTGNQSILVIPSARDDNDKFMTDSTKPDWQKLIVYAPWFNASENRGELRRYIFDSVPPALKDPVAAVVINVTNTDIQVEGLTLVRADGIKVLNKVENFTMTLNAGSVTADIRVQGNIEIQQKAKMLGGARARN